MRHDRDAILARVDLEALADELLGPRLRPAIRMWPCPNPDHHQTGRTPPLSVFTGHNGYQRWHCHVRHEAPSTGWGERTHLRPVVAGCVKLEAAWPWRCRVGWEQP